jgi:hypothetical protein
MVKLTIAGDRSVYPKFNAGFAELQHQALY